MRPLLFIALWSFLPLHSCCQFSGPDKKTAKNDSINSYNPREKLFNYSFIGITTNTGAGPFLRKTPGMHLYRPVVPVIAKQFYSPRYTTPDEKTTLPDKRTTVYWNPEVITDQNGKAVVSFYTSESSSSSYMIIVQGTNLTGGLGVLYQPLVVQ
ncbi:hypothetical protein A8C56_16380 [Niabella ginsenosidivorans]|uniref:Uncharacterized protein n=1 Tax=Niabella ginsenosidivorans TaxID=1176587 RepID=A0A1A9I3S4_9BACT|nr:hypothetical protein [Niabella ginsenosidivorans]ANH82327.1 hypothetical protein A8C56_16380 [Niabella ginsenosidivorans]